MCQPLEYGLAPNVARGRYFRAFLALALVGAVSLAYGFLWRAAELAAGADEPNANLSVCVGIALGGLSLLAGLAMLTRSRVAAALAAGWLGLQLALGLWGWVNLLRNRASLLNEGRAGEIAVAATVDAAMLATQAT